MKPMKFATPMKPERPMKAVIHGILLGCRYLGGRELPRLVEVETAFGPAIEVRHSALTHLGMPATIHTGELARGAGVECVLMVGLDIEVRGRIGMASLFVQTLQQTGYAIQALLDIGAIESALDIDLYLPEEV